MTYTPVTYAGDGATRQFAFAFDYIDDAHVKATLDGVETVDFSIPSSGIVEFTSAPGAGVVIVIFRLTPSTPLVSWNDGAAILGADLNLAFLQSLYIAEETEIDSTFISASLTAAATNALNAAASEASAASYQTTIQALHDAVVANIAVSSNELSPYCRTLDDISGSFNGVQTAFTLQYGGNSAIPISASQILVFYNGVFQKPGASYSIAGGQISFTFTPEAGDVCVILELKAELNPSDVAFDPTGTSFPGTIANVQEAIVNLDTRVPANVGVYLIDDISPNFNDADTEFSLTENTQTVTPNSVKNIICYYNGVRQWPGRNFSISGSNIVFTFTPASGDQCDIMVINS